MNYGFILFINLMIYIGLSVDIVCAKDPSSSTESITFWGLHSLFLYEHFCLICDAMVNINVVDVLRDMRLLRSNWRHTV